MKNIKKGIIALSVSLISYSLIKIVVDIVNNSKDLNAVVSLSLPKEALILITMALIFLIVFYLFSFVINKIKRRKVFNNSKTKRNKKTYTKQRNILDSLSSVEKDVLTKCFIEPDISVLEVFENDQVYRILKLLCHKDILKEKNYDPVDIDYLGIRHYVFYLNDWVKGLL